MKLLIQNGADVNAKETTPAARYTRYYADGTTPVAILEHGPIIANFYIAFELFILKISSMYQITREREEG